MAAIAIDALALASFLIMTSGSRLGVSSTRPVV
jgi:hypothetical protein